MTTNKTIVMGIGNPLLQDDRAGLEVVQRIARMNLPVDTEELYTVGFDVMDKLMGYEQAFVVDSCCLGHKPGTMLQVSIDDIFSSKDLTNSHAVTLGATLKTGYELFSDEMPKELTIILIEIEKIEEFTDVMCPSVEKAVQETVCMLEKKIKNSIAVCPANA